MNVEHLSNRQSKKLSLSELHPNLTSAHNSFDSSAHISPPKEENRRQNSKMENRFANYFNHIWLHSVINEIVLIFGYIL